MLRRLPFSLTGVFSKIARDRGLRHSPIWRQRAPSSCYVPLALACAASACRMSSPDYNLWPFAWNFDPNDVSLPPPAGFTWHCPQGLPVCCAYAGVAAASRGVRTTIVAAKSNPEIAVATTAAGFNPFLTSCISSSSLICSWKSSLGLLARQLVTLRLPIHSKRGELATSGRVHVTLPASHTGLLSVCRRCCGLPGREDHRGSNKQRGDRAPSYPSENRRRLQPIRDIEH